MKTKVPKDLKIRMVSPEESFLLKEISDAKLAQKAHKFNIEHNMSQQAINANNWLIALFEGRIKEIKLKGGKKNAK